MGSYLPPSIGIPLKGAERLIREGRVGQAQRGEANERARIAREQAEQERQAAEDAALGAEEQRLGLGVPMPGPRMAQTQPQVDAQNAAQGITVDVETPPMPASMPTQSLGVRTPSPTMSGAIGGPSAAIQAMGLGPSAWLGPTPPTGTADRAGEDAGAGTASTTAGAAGAAGGVAVSGPQTSIRALRLPSGKILYTNLSAPKGAKEVSMKEAVGESRAGDQATAQRAAADVQAQEEASGFKRLGVPGGSGMGGLSDVLRTSVMQEQRRMAGEDVPEGGVIVDGQTEETQDQVGYAEGGRLLRGLNQKNEIQLARMSPEQRAAMQARSQGQAARATDPGLIRLEAGQRARAQMQARAAEIQADASLSDEDRAIQLDELVKEWEAFKEMAQGSAFAPGSGALNVGVR